MRFRFKNKNEPFDYVQFLVETMFVCNFYYSNIHSALSHSSLIVSPLLRSFLLSSQMYPPEHVLSGVHLTSSFDPAMIAEFLTTYFSPTNLRYCTSQSLLLYLLYFCNRITVSAKKFAGTTDQVEAWYGTPFKEEVFEQSFVEVSARGRG